MEFNEEEKVYMISRARLRDLIIADATLQALEAGGVDNWCWYSESFQDYLNFYNKENHSNVEDFTDLADEIIDKYYTEKEV